MVIQSLSPNDLLRRRHVFHIEKTEAADKISLALEVNSVIVRNIINDLWKKCQGQK